MMYQDQCNLGDHDELPWCSQRVIYSVKRVSGWFPSNDAINHWIHTKVDGDATVFANFISFKAVVQAFVFRPQARVRSIILNKVRNSFVSSATFRDDDGVERISFDPFHSV